MRISSYFSAMLLCGSSLQLNQLEFVANHPFVFVIKNVKLGIVLFAGRLSHV
jgi:serine protease inhibitor